MFVRRYLQLFAGGLMSYLRYQCLFALSLLPVVLQEGSCLIYVISVCLVRLYLQLFVGGFVSYLRYQCLFVLSLPPVVCRRAHVLFTLLVFVWFVFTSSCFAGGFMSYLRYQFVFGSSLPPVVCRRVRVLFTLFVCVWFVFTSSCLQEGSCLIYVISVCLVRLYLQLFVGGFVSYLRYQCVFGSSLPPVVCRRAHVLFTLLVFVWFVFISSCLQEGSCLIYVISVCLVRLYLQLFVGGFMSYLRYQCVFGSSLPPVVCRRVHVLFTLLVCVWFVLTSSCLQEGSCLIYVIGVCLVRLYLQLFVGGFMSYLRYQCLFGSSLPPVVCRRAHVLFTLLVFVWFVFTSSCLQEGSCLIYVISVCLVRLYLQLFVGGIMSYLRYWCVFGSSLPPVVCRRVHVLFTLLVFVWFVFISSCLQEGSCLIYVISVCLVRLYLQLFVGGFMSYLRYQGVFGSSLPPVVCRRVRVLFTLLGCVWFVFTSSCLQEGSCLIYVISVCLVRLYLQLFVGGFVSYLRYQCLFVLSLPPVVCRRAHVLFTLLVFVWFVFTSSCFAGGFMSYLRYQFVFGSSLPPVVCRRVRVLFTLFVCVWFVFTSSCLQEGSCLIYVISVCLVRLYLQLFVGGFVSYLRYQCVFGSSLPPVVCRRAHVLFTLLVFVWFVFISSCLQEGSCLIYVISVCLVRLYLQLFVGGFMSYLRYQCVFGSSLPPVVCRRVHVLFTLLVCVWFVFTSSCLQEGSCLIYVIGVCLVRLYLQLFVGGFMSYLRYQCLFGSSLPPVVCRRAHVLFTLLVFVWFVFTSSCLQEGSCLIYVISVCLVRLYLQLFVGGIMSYLRYWCVFGSSLPPVVCRRVHVLFTLLVFVWFVFISSCLQEGSCLIYVISVCLVRLYLQLFVGGFMSYLRYQGVFGSSLPPVVCRRVRVLFTLLGCVWFVFTSSCLQEGSCLIYVISVCLLCLYLQLFVGGFMSYLRYWCVFGSSLPPVVCRRVHVLFTLLVCVWFVFTSSCLQEGSCLIYVISVCLVRLYLQLFVGGFMSYLRYQCVFGSSLPPVVCRRVHVLFTLLVCVWFVFTSSCLQEGSCLIYVISVCLVRLYLQLFVGGLMSYLRYQCLFGSSLSPAVCRRVRVLFTLLVFVWFVFTSSCLQEGSCPIYVISVCLVRLYLQLFVGGFMSYLRYQCLFGSSLSPVVCRRVHVLFTLLVCVWFVFTSSCLQEGSCLIYVICVCLVRLYLQLFVGGFMSYLRYQCVFGSSLPPVVCRRVHVLFTLLVFVWFVVISSCLQEGSCLIYVISVCLVCLYLQLFVGGFMSYLRYQCVFGSSLPPVVCRRAHVLFTLLVFVWFVFTSSCLQEGSCLIYVISVCLVRLYLQLFVGGLMSYLRYQCLFGSSLSPVVCRRVHVLFTLLVFVWFVFISSCLQEGSCLIYVISVCLVRLYLQLFVGGFMSYLRYQCVFALSLPPVVCRRVHVLFTLLVCVWFVFTSSCLQEGSCLIYVISVCLVRLYLQLFVGGFMSYLRYQCVFGSSLPPVVCRRVHVLFTLLVFVWFVFISSCLQEGSCLIYVICVWFVFTSSCLQEGSCLIYVICVSSLSPVVCRRVHVLFMLFVFRLYLQLFVGGFMSYLCYLFVCLYLQLFVGGFMSYLCYLCLSLPPVVCRRVHVLFMLFVFVFTSSCLQEGSCLIYVICVCLYLQLFVGGFMSYLCYLCLSLSPVVCRRVHVLFMLLVCVWFVFTSSCLQEGSCLIYVISVCLVVFISSCLQEGSCLIYVICVWSLPPVVCRRVHVLFMLFVFGLYLQLFVGGFMSYLCYLCLSLPPVVCRRVHVLFMLFVFVFTSSCLQEGSCLIYVICVSSLPPVVCRRVHVLFITLLVCVWFVFTSSCLQEGSCLIYVICLFVFTSSCLQEGSCLIYVICVCLYLQLFVGGFMSYLCYQCVFLSLSPVVCRRVHVLFMLFVFRLYLQLFVGGFMSYLCYLCLSLSPVVCRRVHVLFMLFVFVFTSSCLQEGSCLIYVICVCLYLQLFVGGFMSYLCYLCLSLPPVVCRRAHVLFTLLVFVCVCLYLQLFVGGFMSYLCYLCLSLPPVVCRRVHVLFMLFVFVFISSCLQEGSCLIYVICVWSLSPVVCRRVHVLFMLFVFVFISSCLQEGSCLIYVICVGPSLSPVVCRRVHVLFMLFVFVFISSCLQEGSCLIYVICVCLLCLYLLFMLFVFVISSCLQEGSCLIYVICVCLYLQLFVGGFMSYLCYLCLSLSPVVCRRVHVLFMLFVFRLYLQLFVGGFMSYLCYLCLSLPPVVCRRVHVLFMLFVFVFISSCLQEGSCLIYVICVWSLPPVVCRRVHVLFMLFVFVFISSCLQEGSCLIYVIPVVCVSYLCYLCSSLSPVVCRRVHVLFMLFVFVFISSCLQEGSCLIYVICVCLYLQLFVGGFMSYLCYLCLSLPPVVCRRVHVLFMLFVFVFISSCLQEGSCLIYVICVCLYLQLFVGGFMSYLCYLCLSLSPVVCRRVHVLFMLFVFVFTSSCLQEGSCLIYVICVCLYLQLFVGGFMSYLCYLCLSLPPVVCRRVHVLFMLFVFVFISSCLQEGSCLIYVICVCLYLQLFVGGFMSYLCYLCLSLSPVVCRRVHVLFMLFVFVFISSCLQEGSCLIYVICVCLYLQLFVGGFMSYLCYLCLSCLIYVICVCCVSSLSPVVCRRVHVLFMLFVFVFISSCLQEGSCLIYVICVCLYLQLFVGGFMSYLCYLCLSLPPVVCRRVHVLFMLFVFVFISSCLQEGSCLIYVICVCLYLQLFVGGFMSYLCYLCLSLSPVVCRRVHVLFMLLVCLFVFISSCLQEGSCLIYVICVCLYLQLFVGGFMSYLCYLCLSLPPVVCRRVHVLFMLFVFRLYLQLFVGGFMSYLCYLCLFGSSLPPVVCRRVHVLFMLFVFVFTSSCLQEGSCLIYVICVSSLPPVVCRRVHVLFMLFVFVFISSCLQEVHVLFMLFVFPAHVLFTLLVFVWLSLSPVVCRRVHVLFTLFCVWFVFISSCLQEGSCLIYVICVRLYLQLFVGGFMSYLCYLCLSLPPVVCRRVHVLFMLFVFVFISSCLQEGSCLIYVICVCLYLQLFVGGFMSYLCYLCLSLSPVVCRRVHVLFMLFVFVFISSCLQEGSCLIYVICVWSLPPVVCRRVHVLFMLFVFRLYLQLFVGGFMSYLCYQCLFGSSLPPVVCRRVHVLFMLLVCGSSLSPVVCRRVHVLFMLFVFVFISSCLQEGSCLIYVICVCLYLQLFVGGFMSYLCYLCLSLSPVVCRRVHVLFMLFICVCLFQLFVFMVRLYLQLFVGGFMSYLCYLCLSLPPVVCRRVHVLFMLFVFVFISSCLQEGSCLIYVICVCLYLQLFVGGFMSYLCYLCLSLPPVVCRRVHVLFMLLVCVWFVFTSSCLQEGSCLIYVICVCLYLQLFVGGFMSYLCYLCLFGSSLPPVVCRRVHVLFMLVCLVRLYLQLFVGGFMSYLCYLFVWFVFISSCLQEGSCLIYVISVCLVRLYLQLFVGGFMSYLRYLCLSLSPVVCRRVHVLFTLLVFVFVFTSSCLQEGSCLIYVICVWSLPPVVCRRVHVLFMLFVFGSSLPPVVCRRVHVLFMLFVFVFTSSCLQEGSCLIYVILCFVFISSCLQEGSCLIYVISVCLVRLYLQLFVGGFMSYLCYQCVFGLYLQLFVGGFMSYLRYQCVFGSSLPPVVCRRVHVLFTLLVFVWFVFTSSCLQEGSCLIYVICVWSLPPVVCRRVHVLITLLVCVWFVFTSSCLQEGSCLIYVISVCLVRLYLQLFVGGFMSYLRYQCLFGSSLSPVVCRRVHVLFTLLVCVWFVFTSSCLQEGSCLIYVIVFVWFVFTSSCLQEGSCLIYVILFVWCLYLQLFVGGFMSYLCYQCLFGSSLPPVVCRRVHVLFTLLVFVWFVFISSCLQEGSCLIYVISVCLVRLYLQLFVGGFMSYLRYQCVFGSSLPPVVCRRVHVLFTLLVCVWFVFTSSCLQEGSCLIYVISVCLVRLYLQLFVGGFMSYLRYFVFGSSLPPVVCRRVHVLFTLLVFVWFVFISSCLQEGSCLIYVISVCLVRLYLQLFVGGLMSYLRYQCLFALSLPPVVCRRVHVLFTLLVCVWFVFTSSCLQEGSCLIYVISVCLVRLYLQLFVGGLMSYLCYLCLFGSSLPPVVCRRVHVLFTLLVCVWFVFTSSCLQEGSCLIYVISVCLVRLYLQLFVGGFMSYLRYQCVFGSSLPPVVCRRVHVLFTLLVFVWFVFISSCLQEGSCLIYVISVCLVRLYLQLFVGGFMSYLRYQCVFGSALPPVVCRRVHVLFTLLVCVWFVFTSSCLQEGSCLIYVINVCLVRLYLQLLIGRFMSYLRYQCVFGSSLPPVVCRRVHVLFTLLVFVWFVFTSSCLQEGSCLIYVISVCLVHLYLQLFVGGFMSYLRYQCVFGSSLPPVVCRRVHVLFTLLVFVWFVFTSSCLQEGSCLIYVISVCLVHLYLQLFVGGFMS